uniref:Uncharacterized protein n=1 Tax=Romanomermis culicivorax TaxID=13658 RepID=A0A915ITX4_ROMCU
MLSLKFFLGLGRNAEHVREDARGTLFLKDEVGEMYLLGSKTRMERGVLDEDDLPLLRNKIRPDPPVLPARTALELDRLSGHKLRQLLVGSPSSDEKERIAEID